MFSLSKKYINIIKLLLIITSFILPLIAAHYMYYYGKVAGASTNKGNLIANPHKISELHLDKPYLLNSDVWRDQNWHILYVIPDICDQQCLDILYKLQQVHIALGKNKDRIQRVNIHNNALSNNISSWQTLYNTYPHMTVTTTSRFDLCHKGSNSILNDDHIYIADPFGNIIMSYYQKNPEFDKHLFKDIQKLLKLSKIG